MKGPCEKCISEALKQPVKSWPDGCFCHCSHCNRSFLYARVEIDAMCIEQITQHLWKEESDPPRDVDQLSIYLLNHKPYFAGTEKNSNSFSFIDA